MPASLSRGTENPSTCIAFPLPLPHSPLRGNCTQRKCFDIVRSPFISRSAWRLHLAPLSPPRLSRGSSFPEIVAVAKSRRRPANRAAASLCLGCCFRSGAVLGVGPSRAGVPFWAEIGRMQKRHRHFARPPQQYTGTARTLHRCVAVFRCAYIGEQAWARAKQTVWEGGKVRHPPTHPSATGPKDPFTADS